MTALGDRIAAAKRHPADLTYSEWVELLEEWERARDDEAALLRYALSLACSDGWTDGDAAMRSYLEAAATHLAMPGEPS